MNESSHAQLPKGVYPVPSRVSQNGAILPDGTLDPEHATDCGEACCSSVLSSLLSLSLSPGCVRQSIGPGAVLGYTTRQELALWLVKLLPRSRVRVYDPLDLWQECHHLRRTGRYLLLLGHWLSPSTLHWRVAYEGDANFVWMMDPWVGDFVPVERLAIALQATGSTVEVRR